jgi:hypothetical protein
MAGLHKDKEVMSGRWLLEEIVAELGESPAYRTSDLFRQCVEQLLSRPRTLIIDEVDYLAYDAGSWRPSGTSTTWREPPWSSRMDKADKKLIPLPPPL